MTARRVIVAVTTIGVCQATVAATATATATATVTAVSAAVQNRVIHVYRIREQCQRPVV
jgi:Tfp pilus assembly major pilin PilA